MKVKEFREMTPEALAKELLERRREQFNLRMQSVTGQSVRPDQHGKVRRDIARLKTVMREKSISGKDESS